MIYIKYFYNTSINNAHKLISIFNPIYNIILNIDNVLNIRCVLAIPYDYDDIFYFKIIIKNTQKHPKS